MPNFVIPPDTRAPGTGNPAQDVDQLSDMEGLLAYIAASQAGFPGNPQIPTGNVLNIQALQPYLNGAYTGLGLVPSGGDDGVNVQNLINLGVRNIYLQAGNFTSSRNVVSSQPPTYIFGAGNDATIWTFTGSGDAFRFYSTQQYTSGWGGGMKWMTVDGFSSGGTGSCGIHAGDIYHLEWDCGVRGFRADPTAKGFWFDNQYWYAEEMRGRIWAEQNANNVVFDNSANLNNTASPVYFSTGSFKGTRLEITLDCKGSGNGIVIQNGAEVYNSDLTVIGNIDYAGSVGQGPFAVFVFNDTPLIAFTANNASPCTFTYTPAAGAHPYNGQTCNLAGASLPAGFTAGTTYFVVNTNPPAGTFQLASTSGGAALASTSTGSGNVQFFPHSQIKTSHLLVGVELNAVNANAQPFTINFGNMSAQTAGIFQCYGLMDFTANNPFAINTTGWAGNLQFDGPIFGDQRLLRVTGTGRTNFEGGTAVNGTFFFTRYSSIQKVSTTSSATVTGCGLTTGSIGGESQTQDFTLVNLGPGAIQMAASGSHVLGGSTVIIQPNTAARFVWEMDGGNWVQECSYPVPDGSAADIQPVGTAAAAGSTGLVPDAGHVHLGFFGGLFGNGSDGTVNFNGSNTFGFATLAGSVYSLTRDVQASSVTVAAGVTVKMQSFRMFCKGTVTIASTGIISNNGGNASGSSAGPGAGGSQSFPAGRSGGAGGTGVSGTGGAGGNSPMGGNGGSGGAGTSGAAGAGGTGGISIANAQNNLLINPAAVLAGVGQFGFNIQALGFGSGGGGGGSDASSNAGGGGGGGGGVVAILAYAVANSGTISATGGNGASGTAGNAGGGGGAAGGLIIVYTLSAWTAGTTSVAGGSAGSGSGTGSAGVAGASGLVLNSVLS